MTVNQNLAKGFFLLAIALFFGIQAVGYTVGSFSKAGPGMFPLIVSLMLLTLSGAVIVRTWFMATQPLSFNWRNIGLVTVGLIGFALISEYVNMLVAIVAMVLTASYASDDFKLSRALILAGALSLIALAMRYGLGFQLPLY